MTKITSLPRDVQCLAVNDAVDGPRVLYIVSCVLLSAGDVGQTILHTRDKLLQLIVLLRLTGEIWPIIVRKPCGFRTGFSAM